MSAEVAECVRWKHTCRVITVNTTFQLAHWADMFYAADINWWKTYWEQIKDLPGLKVTCSDQFHLDVLRLRVTGKTGFDENPECIRTGGNSGYQSIHIAAQAGASKILLCGFDMSGGHWHSRHTDPLRNAGEGIYKRWVEHFDSLVPELASRNVEVVNCTPNSALKAWPYVPLEQAINETRTLSYT